MAATWLGCVIEQGAIINPGLLLMAAERFSLPADKADRRKLHTALVRLHANFN